MDDMNEREDRERIHLVSEVSVMIFLSREIVEEIISSSAYQPGSTALQKHPQMDRQKGQLSRSPCYYRTSDVLDMNIVGTPLTGGEQEQEACANDSKLARDPQALDVTR
jgi:hypothetical protein